MKIETPCRDCIFQELNGKTQTGCKMARLDKLKNAGAEILECYDEQENEFYLIKGIFCNFKRNKEWARKHKKGFTKRYSAIRSENAIKFTTIIIGNKNIENILLTFNSINLALYPNSTNIIIINKQENFVKPSNLTPFLKTEKSYKIETILDNDFTENQCIDLVVKFLKTQFYLVIHAGYEFPYKLGHDLDSKINEDLFKFGIILPDDNNNGKIVPISIHKFFQGNYLQNLEGKMKENQCESMIMNYREVFSEYPIEYLGLPEIRR